jgi:hypothetical protein
VTKQLLLNYCLGHPQSPLLLYPYGPMFHLVNHFAPARGGDGTQSTSKRASAPNVRLRWSRSEVLHSDGLDRLRTNVTASQIALQERHQSGWLLELVATRDISRGEEILMDYGDRWHRAWSSHVEQWKPVPGADRYAPSYVHDDAIRSLRTEAELRDLPYPDNVFTTCFYKYSDNKVQAEGIAPSAAKQPTVRDEVTTFRWKQTRGIYELRHLRPCSVLKREHGTKEGTVFTVRVRNRPGLSEEERIPEGALHIVTHVPRRAVRFSDHPYTTDQHLENAFRHEIDLPDAVMPDSWRQ